LATAKVLYENGLADKDKKIEFNTRSGILTSKLAGEKIELDFPSKKVIASVSDNIIESFVHAIPKFVGTHDVWCLIELDDEQAVRQIKPDFELLKSHQQKIFIVTAKSANAGYDFVSRCFGPAFGINEDPVTGSAHCYLSTYWAEKINKTKLTGFQVSERTGIVECELLPGDRVLLRGNGIIMSEIKQNWG
jgi:PhzF family phenazine biosynthesis protein